MSRPLDRTCNLPPLGEIDAEAGEFWVENPFLMPEQGKNLSAYERNRLYLNLGGREFLNASFASGADLDADSRAAIAADFDRDGGVDLLVLSAGGGPLRLFRNQVPGRGGYLRVVLQGGASNRSGFGTRLVADVEGQRVVRDVFPAAACLSQSPGEVVLGLGRADRVTRLEVRWPSGTTQQFENLPANRVVRIGEGVAEAQLDAP